MYDCMMLGTKVIVLFDMGISYHHSSGGGGGQTATIQHTLLLRMGYRWWLKPICLDSSDRYSLSSGGYY